ncbi:unnamed protein product, partial [Candidula unifasciata]
PPSPDVIRKFRSSFHPDVGQMRIFYGNAYDPHRQWAAEMTHGVKTQQVVSAKEIVQPECMSLLQQTLHNLEESSYRRTQKGPLGKSYDQIPGLPKGLDPMKFTFGMPTPLDIGAGALINPNKNCDQVIKEASDNHDMYVKTHADFYPLERVCRNYTSSNFHPQNCYGLPTPHCNSGKTMKESLKLFQETRDDLATKIVSKRLEDYKEKYQPQLGKPIDPIKDSLIVPPDHTFGAIHKPSPFGAGDIIHNRQLDNILKGKESQRGVVAAMRQQLKKLNYHHFNNLLDAFRFYDKDGKGKITLSNLHDVCMKYRLPVDIDILDKVFDYCDVDRDGMINYIEFCNFLNWKDKMPTGLDDLGAPPVLLGADNEESFQNPPAKLIDEKNLLPKTPQTNEVTVQHLQKQIDFNVGDHFVSSSRYNAVVGPGGIPTEAFRTYGIPTVRSDLPAPHVKRLQDRNNYGDEAKMYSLLYPSLYSQHNVYERDLLQPRSYEEIWSIFTNIGVRMTGEEMEKAYKKAASSHPKGFVSVESFKNVLDDVQVSQIRAGIHPVALGQAQMH